MNARLLPRPAKLELNEAAEYYDSESAGLGQAFITEVERCTEEIVRYPDAGLVMRGSIRRRLIRRFPYGLLDRVTSTEIRILAVMNLKRRPAYWVVVPEPAAQHGAAPDAPASLARRSRRG